MKIVVTDACIFIDIHDLELTPAFFFLPLEIHTSVDVFNELYDNHKAFLQTFIAVGKLTLHTLSEQDRPFKQNTQFPLSLSEADKSTIYIAVRLQSTLLSSDKAVRRYAKTHDIPHHGMLWIIDLMIESGVLQPLEASKKLKQLFTGNITYQNNQELLNEAQKRIELWEKNP